MSSGENDLVALSQHPLRVRPAGNAYTAATGVRAAAGCFRSLPDEIIIEILEALEPPPLLQVGNTCKFLYAFARFEELWKSIVVR